MNIVKFFKSDTYYIFKIIGDEPSWWDNREFE